MNQYAKRFCINHKHEIKIQRFYNSPLLRLPHPTFTTWSIAYSIASFKGLNAAKNKLYWFLFVVYGIEFRSIIGKVHVYFEDGKFLFDIAICFSIL